MRLAACPHDCQEGSAGLTIMCCVVAGRNIHALDPYRMPSQAALERGSAVAQGIIDSHLQANGGAYPETVAVCV
jgi:cobalamin biosynthesis Mg chelatase CobN